VLVLVMLAIDLGVFNRREHEMKWKEALAWSGVWVGISAVLGGAIYLWRGEEAGLSFAAGYLIEKSLSVDNLFVFLSIFSYFRISGKHQHKILVWGILGALVLRGAFIFSGVLIVERLHWVLYIFGAFLVFTGLKMAFQGDKELHPEKNPVLKLISKVFRVEKGHADGRFFVKRPDGWAVTTLFVALVFIETTDLLFAVDSIPAVIAITNDPFLIYTSNVCAVLGLRTLYFVVAGAVSKFEYLKYGLAAILIFVGVKMLLKDHYPIPVGASLSIVASMLLLSITASTWLGPKPQKK
jgi:tellurite resistance protein TerC